MILTDNNYLKYSSAAARSPQHHGGVVTVETNQRSEEDDGVITRFIDRFFWLLQIAVDVPLPRFRVIPQPA